MTPDQKKLELITESFIRCIIRNSFDDPKYYDDLAHRLATIIDLEIKQNLNHEKTREELMQFWPADMRN